MGALPPALAARAHRVMAVTPRHTNGGKDASRYGAASPAATVAGGTAVRVRLGGQEHELTCHHLRADGVDWVFVDHPVFQRPGTPYGESVGWLDECWWGEFVWAGGVAVVSVPIAP
jgi:hypothetical protein